MIKTGELLEAIAIQLNLDQAAYSDELLWHFLNFRAKYIKQHIDKNGYDERLTDTLRVELVKEDDKCHKLNCPLLVSRYPIPETLRTNAGANLQGVYKLNGDAIGYTNYSTHKYEKYSVFSTQKYFMDGNYLYVTETQKLKAVDIKGIFLGSLKHYACADCYRGEFFPIYRDQIPAIIAEFKQLYQDVQEDAEAEVDNFDSPQ